MKLLIGAVVIQFRNQKGAYLEKWHGRFAHAALLQAIGQADSDLATDLHDMLGTKPFSISPLWPLREGKNSKYRLETGENAYIRIATWHPRVWNVLSHLETGSVWHVGRLTLEVEKILIGPDAHPRSGYLTVDDLIRGVFSQPACKEISFHFLSPVSFRKSGTNVDYPVADPVLIWGSLANKWNQGDLPVDLDVESIKSMATKVFPTKWKGQTSRIFFGRDRGLVGFTGTYSFSLELLNIEEQHTLLTLAQFALFAGVGRLTGQGLGQTDVTFS